MKAFRVHNWFGVSLLLACLVAFGISAAFANTDVTSRVQINKGRMMFDRLARMHYFDASMTLIDDTAGSLHAPIRAVIENISPATVTIANPDGVTDDGFPYFDYSDQFGDGVLELQETSGNKLWRFDNPAIARFTYQVRVVQPVLSSKPEIVITNPVSGGILGSSTPYIAIEYTDASHSIDTDSLVVEINAVDRTNLFTVNDSKAAYQFDEGFSAGIHEIKATISNSVGQASSATASFTVSPSGNADKYLFSIDGNSWIFSTPGDGTYREYLMPDELGVTNEDISSLALDSSGAHYFTQKGILDVTSSYGDSTSSVFRTYEALGLSADSEVAGLNIKRDGSLQFSIAGQEHIYTSPGDSTNSIFATSESLDAAGSDLTAVHIGYDGLIYGATSGVDGVFVSSGNFYKNNFLTSDNLGVPGKNLDAFAFMPDADLPQITITSPQSGAFINTTRPEIQVSFSDAYAGIDQSSFSLTINGIDFTSTCSIEADGAQCQPNSDLQVGSNTVVATVSDLAGNSASDSIAIQLGVLRAIPGATPVSGSAPLTVHFSTDGEDPAGTIEIFRWDYEGDGGWNTYDTVARDYNYTYNTPGTYNATLYVKSSTGESATASVTITVNNNPPVATADVTPSNGQVPLTVNLSGSGSDIDGHIISYEWDFEGDGIYDWSSANSGTTTHTYTTVGNFQARFRVTDNSGLTSTAVAAQTIVRAGPPGSPTATASASPASGNAPLNVTLAGNGTDPDNDIVLYEWDFDGDGTYDWASPSNGNATHTFNDAGTHVAHFRVTDATGLTGIDQVLVTVNIQASLSVTKETIGFITDAGMTATASSQYSSTYAASKGIDGNINSYWYTARYQTPYYNKDTWYEVNFNRPQLLTGLSVYWHSTSYMMTRARIDIYDTSGATLYSQEHDLTGTTSVLDLPALDNVSRIRMTAITAPSGYYVIIREFMPESSPMPGTEEEPTGTAINTTISSGAPVTIQVRNEDGQVVRTLVNNEYRVAGSYNDYWNCKDDRGFTVNDGIYYAVMQYIVDGQVKTLDLTGSTGGGQYRPSRQSVPSNANTSDPFNDQMLPIKFTLPKASEVTLFVGTLSYTNTRIRTIYNRVPMPAGSHTVYWDGLDDNENIAVTPPGNRLILGLWGYYLPDNAMLMTGGKPEITRITAEPNYFSPFSEKCDEQGNGEGILLNYTVTEKLAAVELRVYSLETNNLIRTATLNDIEAGENTFFWDGKNNDDEYPDSGDYQVGLIAVDDQGNQSMLKYTLVRFDY